MYQDGVFASSAILGDSNGVLTVFKSSSTHFQHHYSCGKAKTLSDMSNTFPHVIKLSYSFHS